MRINGIHYGLTLMYSYLLPFFEIEETANGFIFNKKHGVSKGLKCIFIEDSLSTICDTSLVSPSERIHIPALLGLNKKALFKKLSNELGEEIVGRVTLMYSPLDARDILEVIILSRNTDYFRNTIKWSRDLLRGVDISNVYSSYIPHSLRRLRNSLRGIDLSLHMSENAILNLLRVGNIGPKTISALMLHGYGNTLYAPVDRHFSKLLSSRFRVGEPLKKYCLQNVMNCLKCERCLKCKYGFSMRLLGKYNGVVQSLNYIASRLERKLSELERILLKSVREYRTLPKLVNAIIERFNKGFQ